MKKALLYWFTFLFIMLWMTSCKSTRPTVIKEVSTKVITETIRDTVFKIEKDSSFYEAYIECVNGKPQIKEVKKETSGQTLNKPKVNINGNILTVECEKRAQELFAKWKEKHVFEEIIREVPVEIKLPLTWWERSQIYAGRLFFLLLLIAAVIWLIKKQFNAYGLK